MAARISQRIQAILSQRRSLAAIRVKYPRLGIGCWLRTKQHFDSASVVKVTILGALLVIAQNQHRSLTPRERSLAWLMITRSDNDAATALWNQVGMSRLQRFLDQTGMTQTVLGQNGFWGLTQITARDETKLLDHLLHPNSVLTDASRGYALNLMAHVISSQRWGVPAGVPTTFTVHVKNGWLPTPPSNLWWINSIGCFTSGTDSYSIVILTRNNPSMSYGVTTVEDIAEAINRQANPGAVSVVPPSRPFPTWGKPDEVIP